MQERAAQAVPIKPSTSAPTHTLRLAALPTAPHLARIFVTTTARQWQVNPLCIEVAELLVSELVTNAVKQTGRFEGPPTPRPTERVAVVIVRVRLTDGALLRLDVWDHDQSPPVLAEQDEAAETGRGLFLVDALAQRWGCDSPAGCGMNGKVVWAEVAA